MIVCAHSDAKKNGRDRHGRQRFKCRLCGARFTPPRCRPLGNLRIPDDKSDRVLQALLEGCSVRSVERMFGIHRDTVLSLILEVGERCANYSSNVLRGLTVASAQCDEIWSWTGCKEKTRIRKNKDMEHGDCWIHTAIDPASKLLLAYHIGRRSDRDTHEFARKLALAIAGEVQLDTDGLKNYLTAIPVAFGVRAHHASVVKVFASGDFDHRYSPAQVVDTKKTARWGNPNVERASTSYIERRNLTIRTNLRRFTRLTIAFSKSRRHHAAMFSLWALWYNFCRPHLSLDKRSPAQAHGLANHRWTISELLENTADHF